MFYREGNTFITFGETEHNFSLFSRKRNVSHLNSAANASDVSKCNKMRLSRGKRFTV